MTAISVTPLSNYISGMEFYAFFLQISLKLAPNGTFENKQAFVQIMTWAPFF